MADLAQADLNEALPALEEAILVSLLLKTFMHVYKHFHVIKKGKFSIAGTQCWVMASVGCKSIWYLNHQFGLTWQLSVCWKICVCNCICI